MGSCTSKSDVSIPKSKTAPTRNTQDNNVIEGAIGIKKYNIPSSNTPRTVPITVSEYC